MARDSQKSKVYRAERASGLEIDAKRQTGYKVLHVDATGPEPVTTVVKVPGKAMTIPECQAYVDAVLSNRRIQRNYGRPGRPMMKVTVRAGRGGGWAGSEWGTGRVISLGVWARQPYVILHELAHHLAGRNHGHDWLFCSTLLDLVRQFMGQSAHDDLLTSFKAHGVRVNKPRKRAPVSPERREQLVAQLAAARAAKAAKQEDHVGTWGGTEIAHVWIDELSHVER